MLDKPVIDKANVLLIGPTGSGKTLIAKTIATILDVPFSMNDATPFTQAGYVGEDVEACILRLLQNCDFDVDRAERGIVFIDEIDKLARRNDSGSPNQKMLGVAFSYQCSRALQQCVLLLNEDNYKMHQVKVVPKIKIKIPLFFLTLSLQFFYLLLNLQFVPMILDGNEFQSLNKIIVYSYLIQNSLILFY